MNFLIIDTSTERGMIAFFQENQAPLVEYLPIGLNQSKTLMTDLKKMLEPLRSQFKAIDAIVSTVGPGSYTGIRIGVAVAQAFAYALKCPLIGLPSLLGFIPENNGKFAAVIDARIGGIYYLKGQKKDDQLIYEKPSAVATLEETHQILQDVDVLVTPNAKMLKLKLLGNWQWEEYSPDPVILYQNAKSLFEKKKVVYPPQTLPLLYLRETEAEREKEKRLQLNKESHKERN